MPIVVDMTGVSVGGAIPLDADDYPAVITKADIHESKSSGEDTLYLDLAVGEEGRNMRWNTSLQPSGLWRLKRMLMRLGIEVPEGPFEFDEADLVGVECVVRVILEPHYRDKNRKTNKITDIFGPDGEDTELEASWG